MARRDQIITLTNRYAIPAVYELREFVDAGGLMSYGPSIKKPRYNAIADFTIVALFAEQPMVLTTRKTFRPTTFRSSSTT